MYAVYRGMNATGDHIKCHLSLVVPSGSTFLHGCALTGIKEKLSRKLAAEGSRGVRGVRVLKIQMPLQRHLM